MDRLQPLTRLLEYQTRAHLGSFALQGVNAALGAIMVYLGFINGLLGIFNLLPALPLDGGSVFQALAWGTTKDPAKANRWTLVSGRIVGWTLIGLGISLALTVNALEGLMFGFVGWLILNGARHAHNETLIQGGLQGLKVSQVVQLRQGREQPVELPHRTLHWPRRYLPCCLSSRDGWCHWSKTVIWLAW